MLMIMQPRPDARAKGGADLAEVVDLLCVTAVLDDITEVAKKAGVHNARCVVATVKQHLINVRERHRKITRLCTNLE